MTLEIKMPLGGSTLEFDVGENVQGLAIEFETDKFASLTYLIYDEEDRLRGQFMAFDYKGAIWLGPTKALSSAYSLAHKGAQKYKICCVTCFNFAMDQSDVEAKITFYTDKDQYIEAYLSQDYVTPVNRWINDEGDFIMDTNHVPQGKKELKNTWFKGDFHSHTSFSDGLGTREDSLYTAKEKGLDFFFATDHLIYPLEWPKSDEVLVMPSSEITTIFGHFNYYFAQSPYKESIPSDQTREENVIKTLEKIGGFLTVNHPFRGVERMKLASLALGLIDGIEVMNSPLSTISDLANTRAAQALSRLWNMGYDVVGRGGSDSHVKIQKFDHGRQENIRLGKPITSVFAKDLSPASIKAGLESGQVVFAIKGRPSMTFTDKEVNKGYRGKSAVGIKADLEEVELEFKFYDNKYQGLSHEWIVDGRLYSLEEGTSSTKTFSSKDTHWIRVDIRDKEKRLVGSVNPLRLKAQAKRGEIWQDMINENPQIKAVIFDKDGTLIHFTNLWTRGTADLVDELNINEEKKIQGKLAAGINEDGEIIPGSPLASGTIGDIAREISRAAGLEVKEEDLCSKYGTYIRKYPEALEPRADLRKLLSSLRARGLKIGLVTSDAYDLTLLQLEALGIEDLVDFTYGGDMLEAKPSPRILMDIEEKYQLGLDEMVYIGDSDIDMRFGSYTQKAIGIKSEVSSPDLSLLADVMIDDLMEVLDLV